MNIANTTVQKTAEWEAVKEERDVQLRQIARAGKQWKNTIGRKIDMEGSSFLDSPCACRVASRLADLTNSVCLSIVLGICEALGR